MKTTNDDREHMRRVCRDDINVMMSGVQLFLCDILDDVVELEAELAALRRVEAEDFHVDRQRWREGAERWGVTGSARAVGYYEGRGRTLAAALADYDAKKGADHG